MTVTEQKDKVIDILKKAHIQTVSDETGITRAGLYVIIKKGTMRIDTLEKLINYFDL